MLVICIMILSMVPAFMKFTVYCEIYVDERAGNYNIVSVSRGNSECSGILCNY